MAMKKKVAKEAAADCMKTWLDRARGQATDIRKISMNFVSC